MKKITAVLVTLALIVGPTLAMEVSTFTTFQNTINSGLIEDWNNLSDLDRYQYARAKMNAWRTCARKQVEKVNRLEEGVNLGFESATLADIEAKYAAEVRSLAIYASVNIIITDFAEGEGEGE